MNLRSVRPVKSESSTVPPSREVLLHEARLAGMGRSREPTLEGVERRRIQLWSVAIVTMFGVAAILLLARAQHAPELDWSTSTNLQWMLLGLAVGTIVYVADRERRLRSLTRLLVDERAINSALVQRLAEVRTLLDVAKAMNSSGSLETILGRIVGAAVSLVQGTQGDVFLHDGQELRVVASTSPTGIESREVDAAATHAARTWDVVTVAADGSRGPGLFAPILHANQLLGVLSVWGHPGQTLGEYDLRAASMFAEHAAFAMSATHKAEASRWQEAERIELTAQRGVVLSAAVADLRDPLTSLAAATKMLKRDGLGDAERLELTEVVARQTSRLSRTLEGILAAQGR